VAGAAVRAQVAALLPSCAQAPHWLVSAAQQCGVRSSYADPAALGPDRWAALIGAWHLAAGACVVVNAGTTMTVDALNGEGVFLGGCIVPGAMLMRAALARDTANLAQREGSFRFFPDNTGDAIASGAVNALAGAVERVVRDLQDITGTAPRVLLSGGDAGLIEQRLRVAPVVVDNLVLEGLLQIARQAD
jgi:type III pantothenate kinase